MISVEELIEATTERKQKSIFKIAIVAGLFDSGTAKVQFDGEDEPSEKEYSCLGGYSPAVGDRVLLASVAGTYIVMNKITNQQAEEEPEDHIKIKNDTYKGSGALNLKTIDVGFTPKIVFCYGAGTKTNAGRGLSIYGVDFAMGKSTDTTNPGMEIVDADGSAAPKIVDNGFGIKHLSGKATLNSSGITYHWIAIG